jgi:hypothetical protein
LFSLSAAFWLYIVPRRVRRFRVLCRSRFDRLGFGFGGWPFGAIVNRGRWWRGMPGLGVGRVPAPLQTALERRHPLSHPFGIGLGRAAVPGASRRG